jgi:pyridoxamine 5'-phosphate oxidase
MASRTSPVSLRRADLRSLLRELPSLAGPLPEFDVCAAPDAPASLFEEWLRSAVAAGVPEPHAMTLSTVDGDRTPSGRVLILKDIDARGWQFATGAASDKGRELDAWPRAALTFYWPALGRQVRARGSVSRLTAEESATDFRARSAGSRVVSLIGRQSERLRRPQDLDHAIALAAARVEREPDLVPDGWTVYSLAPTSVEFWQGDRERRHVRLRYIRSDDQWRQELLWP